MSGLSRTPGKRVWANPHRGFESRPLRQGFKQQAAFGPLFCCASSGWGQSRISFGERVQSFISHVSPTNCLPNPSYGSDFTSLKPRLA